MGIGEAGTRGVITGVAAGVAAGVAVTPVSASAGEDVVTGDVAAVVAAVVAAAVSVGVSVGVAGRGMFGVGTSLAWLTGAGVGEGVLDGEGDKGVELPGAGEGAEGQRLQVAAQ